MQIDTICSPGTSAAYTGGDDAAMCVKAKPIKFPGKARDVQAESAEEAMPLSKDKVIEAIEQANSKLEVFDTRLEFSIHEQTHHIMIKVYRDDQLIREVPPQKILDMVAKFMEMAGLLVDEKA